jgi:hypothetical protein
LLVVCLFFLPPAPAAHVIPVTAGTPVWALLWSLLASIGVPFFALSATAPLMMEWFRQSFPGRPHDRLYAFSNAGSLLALLAYPFLIEPLFELNRQAFLWTIGMALFLAVGAAAAWWRPGRATLSERAASSDSNQSPPSAPVRAAAWWRLGRATLSERAASSDSNQSPPSAPVRAADVRRGSRRDRTSSPDPTGALGERCPALPKWLWVALPACGSGLLLAITNQLSQDVAPTPLLWVVPLAAYLLTFILCFEGPRTYKRALFIPASFLGFLLLAWLLDQGYLQGFQVQVSGYLAVLFLGCMVCHGELYRLRPPAEQLTTYYLALSLGGALGGIFVAIIAPFTFKTLLETPLLALSVPGLVTFILWREGRAARSESAALPGRRGSQSLRRGGRGLTTRIGLALVGTFVVFLCLAYVTHDLRKQSIFFARNFYGAYRVKEGPTMLLDGMEWRLARGAARIFLSGQIYHGLQFVEPAAARLPTTYFSEESGVGLALSELLARTNRHIGIIGLGAGTIAAYGRPGDRIRYYELNPLVSQIAQDWFTFLTNTPAKVDVILGDGRLSLDREPDQGFDLFVLDAFTGDSIPTHLLTDEAMRIYLRHLKREGVMAFHISNSHLDLEPVVRALADRHGLTAIAVPPKLLDPREAKLASMWMLVSSNPEFLGRPAIAELVSAAAGAEHRTLLWTDQHSSILPILR